MKLRVAIERGVNNQRFGVYVTVWHFKSRELYGDPLQKFSPVVDNQHNHKSACIPIHRDACKPSTPCIHTRTFTPLR